MWLWKTDLTSLGLSLFISKMGIISLLSRLNKKWYVKHSSLFLVYQFTVSLTPWTKCSFILLKVIINHRPLDLGKDGSVKGQGYCSHWPVFQKPRTSGLSSVGILLSGEPYLIVTLDSVHEGFVSHDLSFPIEESLKPVLDCLQLLFADL